MSGHQLNLFEDERAPRALIVVFPLSRRTKAVRQAARTLQARKTDDGKRSAWDRIVAKLAGELRRRGVDDAERERQLWAFRSAVGAEMAAGQRQQPGGAA